MAWMMCDDRHSDSSDMCDISRMLYVLTYDACDMCDIAHECNMGDMCDIAIDVTSQTSS